eukprot:CAMPEP_0182577198 /NCGR_PEP_ID=MMETSP1324-20130603/36636_1 /TAXON_ID=236786 /ORGANISM="Florenciella sp., Strain RCC1587" /LENGTH=46 /DNA_ID= /DNA_START= /DNA_END= /DNA_ORIENTATION=
MKLDMAVRLATLMFFQNDSMRIPCRRSQYELTTSTNTSMRNEMNIP